MANNISKIKINGTIYDLSVDWKNIKNIPEGFNQESDVYIGELKNNIFYTLDGYLANTSINKLYIDILTDPDGAAIMYIYKDGKFILIFKDVIINKEIKEIYTEIETLKTNTETLALGDAVKKIAILVVNDQVAWN